MIKARTEKLIIIGLSELNMERLPTMPIKFNLRSMGADLPDMDVWIFCGKTEESMTESLKNLITDKTDYRNEKKDYEKSMLAPNDWKQTDY